MTHPIIKQIEAKNPANNKGQTPLHLAAINNHLGVVQRISQRISDKNPRDTSGITPLHEAAKGAIHKPCERVKKLKDGQK